MRYSCEEGDDSAEGFAVGEEGEGDVGWVGLRVGFERWGGVGLMYMSRVVWSSVLLGVGDYCILALSGLGYWRYGLYKGFLDNEPGLVGINQC